MRGKLGMKVMSYNIHHGADSNGVYNLEKTADVIRHSKAEVIGLQEVDRYYSQRSRMEDTIERLSGLLGMHYAYGPNLDRAPFEPGLPRRQYGCAVLSRHPILRHRNHALTSCGEEPRGLLETVLDFHGVPIFFYCTHLGLDAEQQRIQTDELLNITDQPASPRILVGDFNTDPSSPDMRRIAERFQEPFADRTDAYTFDSIQPYTKIDYIWASDDWVQGSKRHTRVLNVHASDHLPIVSDFYLKREP